MARVFTVFGLYDLSTKQFKAVSYSVNGIDRAYQFKAHAKKGRSGPIYDWIRESGFNYGIVTLSVCESEEKMREKAEELIHKLNSSGHQIFAMDTPGMSLRRKNDGKKRQIFDFLSALGTTTITNEELGKKFDIGPVQTSRHIQHLVSSGLIKRRIDYKHQINGVQVVRTLSVV